MQAEILMYYPGSGLRAVGTFFPPGVRVHRTSEIVKREPSPALQKEPGQQEPLEDFEQENTVIEFSYSKEDSGSNVEEKLRSVRCPLQQARRETRFHVKIQV